VVQNQIRAYSAITGTRANLSVNVNAGEGDTYLVDTNVALVVQPVQNQIRAYSAITGTWVNLSVNINAGEGDTYLVDTNVALVVQPVQNQIRLIVRSQERGPI